MYMYAIVWAPALLAGCADVAGAGELAAALRAAGELDPAWACVLDEADEAEASVVAEFGWYSMDGGRAVWCDLPGYQSDEAARAVFVPLGAAVSWESCEWSPSGGDCAAEAEAAVAPTRAPVVWECADGTPVPLGDRASWDCAALGWAGDATRTVSAHWESAW